MPGSFCNILLVNPYRNLTRCKLWFPFYRLGNWASESLIYLPEMDSMEVDSSPESVWLQSVFSFIHSFTQQMFMEHPLFVRDFSQTLEYSQEQNRQRLLSVWGWRSSEEIQVIKSKLKKTPHGHTGERRTGKGNWDSGAWGQFIIGNRACRVGLIENMRFEQGWIQDLSNGVIQADLWEGTFQVEEQPVQRPSDCGHGPGLCVD